MTKEKKYGCYDNTFQCIHRGFGIDPKNWKGALNWCNKETSCKHRKEVE